MVLGGNESGSKGGGDKNIDGGPDNDFVGAGADGLTGGDGDHFLVESDNPRERYTDTLAGGDDDLIQSINKPAYRDVVVCGSGFDRVAADSRDDGSRDCDKVAVGIRASDRLFDSLPRRYLEDPTTP